MKPVYNPWGQACSVAQTPPAHEYCTIFLFWVKINPCKSDYIKKLIKIQTLPELSLRESAEIEQLIGTKLRME